MIKTKLLLVSLVVLMCSSNPQKYIATPREYFIGEWKETKQTGDINFIELTDSSYFHFIGLSTGGVGIDSDMYANTWIIENNLLRAIGTKYPNQRLNYDYQYQTKTQDTLLLLFLWKQENTWRTFARLNLVN